MGKDLDLLHAVKNNDVGAVRKILSKIRSTKPKKSAKKYNVNIQDEDGFTALHHSALKGNTDITMALLDVQCNVNARDKKGMAPLHLASWAGKTEIAKLLVDARACVNICADSGDTPLHLACQHCNIGVVEVLLDSNVDSTVVNKNGESALDLACRFGHAQVVDMLLKSKDCNKLLSLYEQNPSTADPPLHIACKTGREEIVVMLLDAGADVNQKGANGTPLHEASLYGKKDVVRILLDNGAEVNISNDEGHLPLDLVLKFTSSRASQEIKDLLREASKTKTVTAKAIHDYQNIYDPTCLAFRTGDVIEILEQNETGRWKGKITSGKRELVGYFPSTMVKISNARKSRSSGKTMSMKNAGVLPVGKYEVVALPSASGQSSPMHGARPRMSSFGSGNLSPSPPVSPEKEQKRATEIPQPSPKRNRPNPIANGLEQSKLFNKTKESLQYVEVSVDNTSPPPTSPPTSPGSANGFRTQYAEVVLNSPVNGTSEDDEPPSLPQKSYKQENEVLDNKESKGQEDENSIWVRNSPDQPELPLKASSVAKDKTTVRDSEKETDTQLEHAEQEKKREENDMKDENENGITNAMKDDNASENEEDLLLIHTTSSDLDKAIQNLDSNRPNTPERPRVNYEDMSLNSPDRESLQERYFHKDVQFPPRKLEFHEREFRGSPSTDRRQVLTYENVELHKHRPEGAAVTTMLITDIDQEVDPDYVEVKKGVSPDPHDISVNKTHRYENVPEIERLSQHREENYENMEGAGLLGKRPSKDFDTGYVVMQGVEEGSLSKTDSYENVNIKTEESSGSAGYMTMSDGVHTGPNRDYINIQLPASTDVTNQSLTETPSGLTMNEYNSLYDWLESCKLAIYIDNFVQGGFDMTSMAGLTAEDLTAIKINKTGHRKKLLSESIKLKLPSDAFPHERPEDIMTWLRLIRLDQYTPQFIDNGFDDMDFVQDITIEDLVSIGITKPGHQRKIWLAVNALGLAGPKENTETVQTRVAGADKHDSNAEGYLETDLDMVEEKRMKEREGMETVSTDIDSALSRLPADGASDVAVPLEDVSTEHDRRVENNEQTTKKTLDNDMASLQIDSLNDTRGSTPNLDSILDSLDKDPSYSPERRAETPPTQHSEKRSSGPFQMSISRRPRSSDRMSTGSGIQSRSSLGSQPEVSPQVTEISSDNRSPQKTVQSDLDRTVAGLQQNDGARANTSKESDFTALKSRARHNTMDSRPTVPLGDSDFSQRVRGTSFDSKTSKRPPPPVKPKALKKPPPIAPKPTGSPAKTRAEHHVVKKESPAIKDDTKTDTQDSQNTERLQDQIKDVFRRRSQENVLVDQDQLNKSINQETPNTKDNVDTDEELLKDQQYTEELMKDINSMLSDFSTEIDTMFDDQPDKSTSV